MTYVKEEVRDPHTGHPTTSRPLPGILLAHKGVSGGEESLVYSSSPLCSGTSG